MTDETRCRRFTLVDLMALVAAAAASFGILRAEGFFEGRLPARVILTSGRVFAVGAFAILAPATVAALGWRLRRPRPGRRELLCQPGAVACIAAAAAMPVAMAGAAVRTWSEGIAPAWGRLPRDEFVRQILEARAGILREILTRGGARSLGLAGFGIALSWALLAAIGHRRPEPGWIDRTGRALGVAWIASAVYFALIDHG